MSEWVSAGKVRMTPKGTYDSTVSYQVLDTVSNPEGTIYYVANKDVPAGTSLLNTEYWSVVIDANDGIESLDNRVESIEKNIEDLSGGSVNQHVMINPFVDGTDQALVGSLGKYRALRSVVDNENGLTVTRDSSSTSLTYGVYFYIEENKSIVGHKVYLKIGGIDCSGVVNFETLRFALSYNGTTIDSSRVNLSKNTNEYENIIEINSETNQFTLLLIPGQEVNNGEFFKINYIQWIDLTEIFGNGYEPSISTFKSVYGDNIPFDYLIPNYTNDMMATKSMLWRVQRHPILCVSTYRNEFRTDATEYYYAVSYDGRSFYEIKDSRGFASDGLASTDAQPIELNDGLLIVCTSYHMNAGANDEDETYDFKAVFTNDFKSYLSTKVNLGFLEAAYEEEPYVWAPQIIKLNNKYYCVASISTGATEYGDLYFGEDSQTVKTRYLRPYYIEINISTENDELIIEPAEGASLAPLDIHLDDPNASIMDVGIFYSENRRKLCAVYKDRIYNIVNICESDNGDIDGTFTDVYNYLGNMAYTEAGYFTKIGGNEYVYICNYFSRPIVLRHSLYPYYTTKDMIYGWEEVGSINSMHSFADGVDAGMRNPYPIELSQKMAQRLLEAYDIPSTIPDYKVKKSQTIPSNSVITKMSDVIYNTFGKYTEYRQKSYIPLSNTKEVNGETVNCDMCFLNDPMTVVISNSGDTDIKTPNGNSTITKTTNDADTFMITHGVVIKGTNHYVED